MIIVIKGNDLKKYKENLVLKVIQKEVLFGTLLGDATIPKQKGLSSHNLKFEQKIGNKEYIDHLYSIFENFVGTPPSLREIKGGGAVNRYSIWFRTYRHTVFTEYYKLFYKNGKKIVPLNIDEFLTERGLAFWFMDDGHLKKPGSYMLNTYSFTFEDQLRLCYFLKNKFSLDCTLQKDDLHYRIYIKSKYSQKFKDLVFPYIVDCMKYKLH